MHGHELGLPGERRDDRTSAEVISRALDLGVDIVDTAAVYGDGHNERLVGQALGARRDEVVLATKGGLVVEDLRTRAMRRDASPQALRRGVDDSLRRLGTEVIDLYYLHRVDDAVPVEESWGALSELVGEGKLRALGLSEVDQATADRAHTVHPVTAVQSELSLWTRDALGLPGEASPSAAGGGAPADTATNMVAWTAAHGAAFVAYAPLGRGFLTGAIKDIGRLDTNDFRAGNARFAGDAFAANMRIVDVVRAVAARHDATPAQIAIAWTLAQGEHVIPIPGTKKPTYLADNVAAADIVLTTRDVEELDAVPSAVGSRF